MLDGADLERMLLEALSHSRLASANDNLRQRAERMSQVIYGCLREAIQTGRLRPNTRLPAERDIMRMLEVPRGPVRKAFKMLEDSEMVTRRIGSGTYVTEASTSVLPDLVAGALAVSPQDIIEARLAIEPGFAEFVVARATEDDFSKMDAWLVRAEQAPNQRSFREAMYSFHLEVAEATRNPLLITVCEIIVAARAKAGWEKLKRMNETRASQKFIVESCRRIVTAFRNRDSQTARRLLREHFSRVVIEVDSLPFSER